MADGRIELFDVETDEAEELFAFDRFEPVDYGCGVFPLVKVAFFRDCAVDAVEDLFADFAYLGLRRVDESEVGLFAKFGLWSLSVMNASLSAVVSTLSSIPSFVAMSLFSQYGLLASSLVVLSCRIL